MTTPDTLHEPDELTPPGAYDLDFKDFSLPEDELRPKRFKIGADVFTAPPFIGARGLAALAGQAAKLSRLGDLEKFGEEELVQLLEDIGDLMVTMLDKDTKSGERFKARLLSTDNPLHLQKQVLPIIFWLIEAYGLRPTEPPSSSATGSDGGGPTSTAGAPSEASPL